MKTTTFALLCAIAIGEVSCYKESENLSNKGSERLFAAPAELSSTDGLIKEWNALWNTQNAADLYDLMTSNVVAVASGTYDIKWMIQSDGSWKVFHAML